MCWVGVGVGDQGVVGWVIGGISVVISKDVNIKW